MAFIATRRKFGRYVFAIGGNPDAAELAGINTRRRTVLGTFVMMGILCADQRGHPDRTPELGRHQPRASDELDVIAAAVIGGTSFSGGIGTMPGAVLGAS
jgi:D-xylose transport system permease protein